MSWLVGVSWVGLIVVGCGGVFAGEGAEGLVVDDEDFVGFGGGLLGGGVVVFYLCVVGDGVAGLEVEGGEVKGESGVLVY